MKYRKIKGKAHHVFDTEFEFNSFFDNPPPIVAKWREAQQGDWVWSDDGRIVQILKRYKNLVLTIVGTFPIRGSRLMDTDFSKHENRYTINGVSYYRKNLPNKRLSKLQRRWIIDFLKTGELHESYIRTHPKVKSMQYVESKVAYLLTQDYVMDEIRKSVMKSADESGVSFKWVFERLKELAEKADNEHVKLNATQACGKYLDMEPKDRPQQLPSYGYSGLIPEAEVQSITGESPKVLGEGNAKSAARQTCKAGEEEGLEG